jgi:acetyl esterase/lipase
MLIEVLAIVLVVAAIVWVITVVFLIGPDHSQYDEPQHGLHRNRADVSAENREVLRLIGVMQDQLRGESRRTRIHRLRRIMDEGFTGSPAEAGQLGVEISATDANGVAAEWVVAPDASHDRRLLYIHGGAFAVGSPRSHRMITAALGKSCNVAVLAIDYRLMPEHRRKSAIADCQNAYRWILDNGPVGPNAANKIFVAGDSAGGNLTLMLSAWARDANIRRMDAVIAFSPSTDSTLENPSMIKNIETDPMLGPGLGPPARMPAPLKALAVLLASQMSSRNPLMSPLFGDLSDLPPTLVLASDCEMLLDDSVRYVNKARSHGSPVTLQIWPGMAHVWPMFQHVLPEARQAIDEVAAFIAANRASAAINEASGG